MQSKLLHEADGQKTYALIFETGDEVIGLGLFRLPTVGFGLVDLGDLGTDNRLFGRFVHFEVSSELVESLGPGGACLIGHTLK